VFVFIDVVSTPLKFHQSELTKAASMASQPPQGYSAQHFALIYIDQFGKIHRRVSPSIAHHRDTILSSHVTAEFLKAVACSTEVGQRRPSPENTSIQYFSDQLVSDGSHNSWYQEISKVEGHIMPTKNGYHGNSTLSPGRGISSSAIIKDQVLNKEICFVKDTMEPQAARLSLKDAKSLRQYYEKVFDNLQQVNCRILAKAYVKFVEPQKQVKYPYNGRKAVAGVIQQLSPEESKPPWWPSQVRHREPDHLLKAGNQTFRCA